MMYINLDALKEFDFKNRYDAQKFIPYAEDVYDILDSYFIRKVKKLRVYGVTKVQGEEARPDLISYRLYDTTLYWYILMLFNDYISVTDILEGDTINYPSVDAMEELYFTLNYLQKNPSTIESL